MFIEHLNNNNNNQDDHCASSIMRVHPVQLVNADSSTGWLPTPRPSQLTWDVSLLLGSCHPHLPLPFYSDGGCEYSFYHPTDGRKLSQPRHCKRVLQPELKTEHMTMAVAGCYHWQHDLNLASLTHQPGASPLHHVYLLGKWM